MRIIGPDIHRVFAEAVALEARHLVRLRQIEMRRNRLTVFARSLTHDDHVVIEATGAAERACTLAELLQADEAFLASTTREVQPVAAVDERSLDAPGPTTQQTAEVVGEVIRRRLADMER